MRKLVLLSLLFCLVPLLLPAFRGWKTISNENFVIYYPTSYELEALNLLKTMEFHRPHVEDLIGVSSKKVSIMIENTGMEANGFADIGNGKISLYSHFPTDGVLAFVEDWWTEVGVHEYIHMLQMSKDSGAPRVMRLLFGDSMYVNSFLPRWMIEGITVYGESSYSAHSGRLNGGYYPAIIASLAHHDMLPSPTKANTSTDDIPLSNHYVVGGSFFKYLADTYGEESFAEFYELNGGCFAAFASVVFPGMGIDRTAKKVYGKDFPALWQDWQEQMKQDYADLRMPQSLHTSDGGNKMYLRAYNGKLYYAQRERVKTGALTGFAGSAIYEFDPATGDKRVIQRQAGGYPVAFQIMGDKLFFSRYKSSSGYANTANKGTGYTIQILSQDLSSGKTELLADGNIRAFLASADGSLVISSEIPDTRGSRVLRQGPQGEELLFESEHNLVHGLFEDGDRIYAMSRSHWRNSSLFELKEGALHVLVNTARQELISGFSEGSLIYTANYEEQLHSYLYDPITDEIKRLDGATFMSDAQILNGKTYYLAMLPQGMELASDPLRSEPYLMPAWEERAPAYIPLKELPTEYRLGDITYKKGNAFLPNLLHSLVPRRYRMPVSYGSSIGVGLAGTDLLGYVPWWDLLYTYDMDLKDHDLSFSLNHSLLSPVHQDLYISTLDGGSIQTSQYLNIINRNNYGFTNLRAGFRFGSKESFDRKLWTPWLSASVAAFGYNGYNELYARYETQDFLASDRERLGVGLYHRSRLLLPLATELNSSLHIAYDPDADTDEVFADIFGFRDKMRTNKGLTLQNSVSQVLFSVREGLWNPMVYLEDVSGGIFFDLALPYESPLVDSHYSIGIEIAPELNVFTLLRVSLGVRFGVTSDKQFKTGLNFLLGY